MPSQSPASTVIPRLARPPQVSSSLSGRPSTGAVPQSQLQQQAAQLSQQQLQQWHAQQLKAYQQRLMEQQILAQQNFTSQQMVFGAAPHYDRDDVPATALPFVVPASDMHHSLNAQEMLMQQMLYQQMYEAALAKQQQQHMKSTVSAGAINLIQHQAGDCVIQPVSSGSVEVGTPEVDQMIALRRASEGQVCPTSTACLASSVENDASASHTVTSAPALSTDFIPASAVTYTTDNSPSHCHDETFKVPLPPDHVCY